MSISSNLYSEITNVYHNPQVRYDTHKKSELRRTYNNIIKQNNASPICLTRFSDEDKEFAIRLKDTLRNFGGLIKDSSVENADLTRRLPYSTDSNSVEVTSKQDVVDSVEPFTVNVKKLATPKVVLGNTLTSGDLCDLPKGHYSFDVNLRNMNYEFQFNIDSTTTNQQLLDRINRLINKSHIGISSEIISNEGNIQIQVSSDETGKQGYFHISDDDISKSKGVVKYVGLDNVVKENNKGLVTINNTDYAYDTNVLTVGDLDLTLKAETNETVIVGVAQDVDSFVDNVNTYVKGFNKFISSLTDIALNDKQKDKLLRDIDSVVKPYKEKLSELGILSKDGILSVDTEQLKNNLDNSQVDLLQNFTKDIMAKITDMSIDPIQYIDRKVVNYKDYRVTPLSNPYQESIYSGMIFNGFC